MNAAGPLRDARPTLTPAPFDRDVSEAPGSARAHWVRAADGTRLRLGVLGDGPRGTVVLMPGRTEYLEKYGRAATRFADAGLSTVAIDFRGQGLSDRLLDDPVIGHVARFDDYQQDVAQLAGYARHLGLPEPWYLLGHSMGGAIGLRALIDGLPVEAAIFSAPMWGIAMPDPVRPVAWGLGWIAHRTAMSWWMTPGTKRESYVRLADPHDNLLTHDPEMLDYMRRHLDAIPGLDLGGPSVPWLYRALAECRALRRIARPSQPVLAVLPTGDDIICKPSIRKMCRDLPDCRLLEIDGGAHETMMETPARRDLFFDAALRHFHAAT